MSVGLRGPVPAYIGLRGSTPTVLPSGFLGPFANYLSLRGVVSGVVVPTPTPIPTVTPSPGGVGRYTGPAFPRRKKRLEDIYEAADLRPPEPGPAVPDLAPPDPGPAVKDLGASPLPKLVDTGPIKQARPLIDPKRQAQENDDEEALVALISRLLH